MSLTAPAACISYPQRIKTIAAVPEDHPECHRFLIGTDVTESLKHPTDQYQLHLVDYLEDTCDIVSLPLPLPEILNPFVDLAVLTATEFHPASQEEPALGLLDGKREIDIQLLFAAGFRTSNGAIVHLLHAPIPKAVDPLTIPLPRQHDFRSIYSESIESGISNGTQSPPGPSATIVATLNCSNKLSETNFGNLKRIIKLQSCAAPTLSLLVIEEKGPHVFDIGSSANGSTRYTTQKVFSGRMRGPSYGGAANPHRATQFATVGRDSLSLWDIRAVDVPVSSTTSSTELSSVSWDIYHSQLDVDFNPNREFEIATAGEDGSLRFWDSRKLELPTKVVKKLHSHWITSVEYNAYHDQLMLTAGTDTTVNLWRFENSEDKPSEDSNTQQHPESRGPFSPSLIYNCGTHDDTVTSVAWSDADPWVFASIGYDKKVAIHQVPNSERERLLL